MFVKLLLRILLSCSFGMLFSSASPYFSSQAESPKSSNQQIVIAELDKPIDAVMEAVMQLGGNFLFLVPSRDFEKRDPPDLGTGRSYSGHHTARVTWGQLASSSPTGPGRRKRGIKAQERYSPNFGKFFHI